VNFLKTSMALATMFSLSGCWITNAVLWQGYQKPSAQDFRPPVSDGECPRVGIQNLSAAQAEVVLQVMQEICKVQSSEAFKTEIMKKDNWLASCDKTPDGADQIPAQEVFEIVTGPKADFSILARKPFGAIAQIDPPKARIAIQKQRFLAWQSGSIIEKTELVETLAHEMTHFFKPDGAVSYRFRDRGHGSAKCPDKDLVSYEVGNITKDLWSAENADP